VSVHSVLPESLCLATSAFPVWTEWTTS
jgi:hypothetical protein